METYSSLNKAGREVTYSPEHKRRGQLGDAPGFGEMQGIFAEAYQMSLGRSPGEALKGQKAIEALNAAMEKGQVISAKILPHVAEIAKRMAEPGLAEARTASFAEQNRFSNQMTDGWKLFREGGGEEGLAHFWIMMQGFGQWWKDNGTQLGMYFSSAVLYLDAIQESIKELFRFAATGESTSITELLKQKGFDVDAIRESFVKLKDSILKLLGLGEGQDGLKVLSERLIVFANDLVLVVDAIRQIVDGVSDLKGYVFQPRKAPEEQFKDSVGNFGKEMARLSPFGRLFNYDTDKADSGVGKIASGVVGGSIDAFKGLRNLFIGGSGQGLYQPPTQNNYLPISLPPLQGNIPALGPIDPSTITGGTRASDFTTHKVDVTLKVEGNQEAIGLLIDSKVREGFPLMLTNEITKSMTAAPIR